MKQRIHMIMEREGMTPARFADSIGIQRSALSHILNGRNNPSLDVVMKILERFDYLSTDWFLYGKGQMFKHLENSVESSASTNASNIEFSEANSEGYPKYTSESSSPDAVASSKASSSIPAQLGSALSDPQPRKARNDHEFAAAMRLQHEPGDKRRVSRIMIFYSDNTFDNFIPE